ncbi:MULTISPECIES: glycosyltransferase family 4 protein [Vibrio harveyi group]|uniref:glycosyltransferase family 4 protein n=2 Tax=Vibrio TaxID=662 RepID=UPI00215BFF2C|nr:glycosyltransferase family 4 protein [Vibrio parahaemolyticus]MCR9730376.1 glycosyltransferase family 4 protein [Vibrio parahaemolyticus]MCR9751194.1 glycosyltransferase family 4 protein [Vibrio parahaemolyticus]MCR9787217.1 glycosyltransferase family 4 protein [Vibrio parahaemolyticus]MCR9862129.1 glycosyltransferase family 4 protein [Vibrio parahaemolyticus]MDF4859482.1 glycosyltransferase family 4 protein [Vibrio parahaemolyticus]
MSNICFFVGSLEGSGGTERVSIWLANELSKLSGHDVYILSLQGKSKPFFPVSADIRCSTLFSTYGSGTLRFPLIVSRLKKFLKNNAIDILIDVESMLALYSTPAICGTSVRHICWEHFNYKVDLGRKTRRFARRLAALFADDVVTLTERDKQLWISGTKCKANLVSIPNPITVSKPTDISQDKDDVVLAVGRLTYQKGFDILLEAWQQVSKEYPQWKLKIIGSGEDEEALSKRSIELDVTKTIEFIPKTNQIENYYLQSKLFVMSSRFEGLPLVLIEAQAYGLPIVSFDCDTGPAEVVQDGHNGWLCEANNIIALKDSLIKGIEASMNSERYQELTTHSINNSKRFSTETILSTWLKLLSN